MEETKHDESGLRFYGRPDGEIKVEADKLVSGFMLTYGHINNGKWYGSASGLTKAQMMAIVEQMEK